jgi:hypothetical protein
MYKTLCQTWGEAMEYKNILCYPGKDSPQERQTCVQTCTSQGSRVGGSVKGIIFIVIFTGGCPWHLTRQNLSDLCHTVSQWDQTQDQPRGANAQPCLLRIIPLERKVLEVGPGHTPLQLFPPCLPGQKGLSKTGREASVRGGRSDLPPLAHVPSHYPLWQNQVQTFFFWDRVSICSPSWPWIWNFPVSASQVLGLQEACHHAQLRYRLFSVASNILTK